MSMVRALIWKDCRVNLLVLIVAAVMVFGPLLMGVAVNLYHQFDPDSQPFLWRDILVRTSLISSACSLLSIVLLGGNAIAGERADRSAEFLAYLPPSRGMILVSKVIVAVGVATGVWLFNLAVIYVLAPMTGPVPAEWVEHLREDCNRVLPVMFQTSVFLFGAAWLGSAIANSPAVATGLGFIPPAVTMGLLMYFMGPEHEALAATYRVLALSMGVTFFLTGGVVYLRRVAP